MTNHENDEMTYNDTAIRYIDEVTCHTIIGPRSDHERLLLTAAAALLDAYGYEDHVATLRAFAIITLLLAPNRRFQARVLVRRNFGEGPTSDAIWVAALGDCFTDISHPSHPDEFIL